MFGSFLLSSDQIFAYWHIVIYVRPFIFLLVSLFFRFFMLSFFRSSLECSFVRLFVLSLVLIASQKWLFCHTVENAFCVSRTCIASHIRKGSLPHYLSAEKYSSFHKYCSTIFWKICEKEQTLLTLKASSGSYFIIIDRYIQSYFFQYDRSTKTLYFGLHLADSNKYLS